LSEEEQEIFLKNILRDEKIILDKVTEFKLKYPSWQNNDLAIFAYLYTQYPDYILASSSGLPTVAQERKRVTDDMFLARLHEALAYQRKIQEEGVDPIINECDHVKNLEDIRKIEDEKKRNQVMVRKFLPMFEGKTENKYIMCKVCDQHIFCEHKRLMILAETHPKNKDDIYKDLITKFGGGGVFGGEYTCSNCGESIQGLELYQGSETNDEGVHMEENEPSEEETATSLEKLLDTMLKSKTQDGEPEAKLYNTQQEIMKILNEIAINVHVSPAVEGYQRMLKSVEQQVENRPYKTIESYNNYIIRRKQADKEQGKNRPYPNYDQYTTEYLISNCIAAVLIEVQGAIPEYPIHKTVEGCGDKTFEGYPLMTDEKQIAGLHYISCATTKLIRNEAPWGTTFWATMSVSKQGMEMRKQILMAQVKAQLAKMMNDATVQTFIEKKREYLRKEKGEQAVSGKYVDNIPSDFLPDPIVLTKEQLKNAEAPTIGDAATPSQKAFAWLLEGYRLAKIKGVYQKGSPFAEASCCYSGLQSPMLFWKEQSMPLLNPKLPPKGPRGSMLLLKMDLRKPEHLLGEPKPTLMYRLFLRVCFPREGIVNPRVGLQHEPGYNNKCPYCQFEFPVDPRLPPPQLSYSKDKKIQDTYKKEYETEVQELYQEEISALQAAGVTKGAVVEKETFESLLQATNRHFILPSVTVKKVASDIETLQGLASLNNPAPFEGYVDVINELIEKIQALPPNTKDDAEIRLAYGPLSDRMTSYSDSFTAKLVEKVGALNKQIVVKEWNLLWNAPPQTLGEMLRTFLLIPLQKSINPTEFQPTNLLNSRRKAVYSILAPDDKKKLMSVMTAHGNQVNVIKNELEKLDEQHRGIAIQQIKQCIEKLVLVIPVFTKVLRANIVPFGSIGLPYIQRSILAGILWELIDPEKLGGNLALRNIVMYCFLKAQEKDENTIKTPEEIRKIIISRMESEKDEIINEFDRMTPEQKSAELAMKALGIGRWARGSKILSYDPEQQAFEAAERARRGITDFGDSEDQGQGYDVSANDGED
jgi:hypothetical protein